VFFSVRHFINIAILFCLVNYFDEKIFEFPEDHG
jgi:hypothetical protein